MCVYGGGGLRRGINDNGDTIAGYKNTTYDLNVCPMSGEKKQTKLIKYSIRSKQSAYGYEYACLYSLHSAVLSI